MARKTLTVINIAVSFGLIAWVLSGVGLPELILVAATANVSLLVLALSLHGLGLLFSAMRWASLLNIEKFEISLKAAILLCWIGCFFNALLPTHIGGDVVRSYLASKENGKIIDTAISVFFERVVGITALGILFGIGMIWFHLVGVEHSFWKLAGLSGAGFIGAGCVSTVHKGLWETALARTQLLDKFHRIKNVLLTYKSRKRVLWKTLILSVLLQINVIIYYYIIAAALHIRIPFFYFCVFIPPILILTMLPISVGGIGVREAAFLFFFAPLGISPAEIISLSLWSYTLALIANLSGGVVYCFYRPASG